MYITSLRVEGLRGADGVFLEDLGPRVDLPRGPAGVAVADALTMLLASLHPPVFRAAVASLGLARSPDALEVLEEDGFPVQVSWPDALGVPPLLDDHAARRVTVAAELALDPLIFGRLRELAIREPRLVTALGQAPVLAVKVGWLFTRDLSTASVSLLEVRIGDVGFSMNERPVWLGEILRSVGARFFRIGWLDGPDAIARRLLDASLSTEAPRRLSFQRAAEAIASAPFELGRLELVRAGAAGVEARFGTSLLRSRQFGPAAADALRLCEAVFVEQPDVLIVEAPGASQTDPGAVAEWLADRTQGDDATLEQVFLVPGGSPA